MSFTVAGAFVNTAYADPTVNIESSLIGTQNPTLHRPESSIAQQFIQFGVVEECHVIRGRSLQGSNGRGYKVIYIHHASQAHERISAYWCKVFGEPVLTVYPYNGAIGYSSMFGNIDDGKISTDC